MTFTIVRAFSRQSAFREPAIYFNRLVQKVRQMKLPFGFAIGFALIFVASIALVGCSESGSGESATALSSSGGSSVGAQPDATPIEIVNQRMTAYNSHAIEPFMELYADNVEIFTYPDRSLGKGKKHVRKIFEPMFSEGEVHVEIHEQMEKDSYVVNHETVSYAGDDTKYVSIYEVKNGLIQSVRFVRD